MALVKAESPSSLSTVDSVVPVSSGRLIKPQPASVKVKAKSRKTTTPMNLSCDACRVRRIKCNKPPSGNLSEGCLSCVQRKISCPMADPTARPVRNGPRIAQAKRLFGTAKCAREAFVTADFVKVAEVKARASKVGPNGLSQQLSAHLIDLYHSTVHPQLDIVEWESFHAQYIASKRVVETLPPETQCLAFAMMCWAAVFSDHDDVVPSSPYSIYDAQSPEPRDFTKVAEARRPFCDRLLTYTLLRLDETGALRNPRKENVEASLLVEALMSWNQPARTNGRHHLAAAAELLRDMLESRTRYVIDHQPFIVALFWKAWARDGLSSAISGRTSYFHPCDAMFASPTRDLFRPLSQRPEDLFRAVESRDLRYLLQVATLALKSHFSRLLRDFASVMGSPSARQKQIDIVAVMELWRQMGHSVEAIATFKRSIEAVLPDMPAPPTTTHVVRDLAQMRFQLTLCIHQNLLSRIECEREILTVPSSWYLDDLHHLLTTSTAHVLAACRDFAWLLTSYGASVAFEAGVSAEYLGMLLDTLAQTPSFEEGGIHSDYSALNKMNEIEALVQVFMRLSWCWLDMQKVLLILQDLPDHVLTYQTFSQYILRGKHALLLLQPLLCQAQKNPSPVSPSTHLDRSGQPSFSDQTSCSRQSSLSSIDPLPIIPLSTSFFPTLAPEPMSNSTVGVISPPPLPFAMMQQNDPLFTSIDTLPDDFDLFDGTNPFLSVPDFA